MLKLLTALTIPASAWLLVACSGEPTCDYSKEPYMTAQSVSPLRAPDGLTAPDRSGALVIAPAAAEAKPIPTGKGRCLDRPPSYFATTPKPAESAAPDSADKNKKNSP